MSEREKMVRPVRQRRRGAAPGLALVVLAVCSITWVAPTQAGSIRWAGAWHGSSDRVLSAWGDVTAGKGGVAPSIGLEYGRELDRFVLYGKGTVSISDGDGAILTLGAGLKYMLAEGFEIGCESSLGPAAQSHLWCKLKVGDRLGVGLEKGLQGRYDAFSVTYSLSHSLGLSVYIGNDRAFWTRISVNL